jgi:hypothetical protein
MRTIKVKLFKFEELSQEAQQKTIEKQREYEYKYGDPLQHFFAEECEERAKEKGFIGIELQYSLSYSQGDGLSFSAEGYDNLEELFNEVLGKGKKQTAKLLAENCSLSMRGNEGRYAYALDGQVDLEIENYTSSINCTNIDNIEDVVSQVLELLQGRYLDLCKEFEKDGYSQIEYASSDEALKENIVANEYEFSAEGGNIY